MGMSKHNKEPKTAEEYRQLAQKHAEAGKNQWRTFLKCGVFVSAALISLFLLSLAWFKNNANVSVENGALAANNAGFQLKTYGSQGIYDNNILAEFFDFVTVGTETSDTGYATSGTNTSINWLVSDSSNLGNYSEKAVKFTSTTGESSAEGDTEERSEYTDYAIEPGSEGLLTFYIVPGTDGTQTFDFTLSIIPYEATIDNNYAITDVKEVGTETTSKIQQYAREFIAGHILFFTVDEAAAAASAEEDNESTFVAPTNITWIADGTFSITIENAVKDQEYAYTLYWKWPQVFSELVLNAGDSFLNSRTPIFTEEIRDAIVGDMVTNPAKYFYNSLTKKPLSTRDDLVSGEKGIQNIHELSPASNGSAGYSAQNFVDLSSFYNQADQIIGSNISFIRVELSAQQGGTAND